MDRRKIVRRNTQSFGKTTEKLPIDLIIEILSRLRPKSVSICRCVSKKWNSLLVSQEFTESFLKISSSRPRNLFSYRIGSELHIFSSPDRPQKFGDNLSVVATEDYRLCSDKNWYMESCQSVHGFIYLCYKLNGTSLRGIVERVRVICNPSTSQLIYLPKLGVESVCSQSDFVYDPIQKQFKILCSTNEFRPERIISNILTLGTGELLWRRIECSFLHYLIAMKNGVCINGVLYYRACIVNGNSGRMKLVCFDVSSEKFSFIKMQKGRLSTLINYKGKLGVLVSSHDRFINCAVELWVLDNTKKDKWSKQYSFVLPRSVLRETVWATDTGEIVWGPPHSLPISRRRNHPFYVFYYNLERQSVRRVEIKGMEDKLSMDREHHFEEFFSLKSHVENLMVMHPYKKSDLNQDIVIKRVRKKSDFPTEFSQDGLLASSNVNREDISNQLHGF